MNPDTAEEDPETRDYIGSSEYLSESDEHHSSTMLPPSAILQPPPSFPLPPSIADHNSVTSSTFRRRRACLDQAPNCFYLRSLCHNKFYRPIMEKNCARVRSNIKQFQINI